MDIKEFLFRKDLSCAAFARALDVTPHTIREYLKGRVRISPKLARNIERFSGGQVVARELLAKNPPKKSLFMADSLETPLTQNIVNLDIP